MEKSVRFVCDQEQEKEETLLLNCLVTFLLLAMAAAVFGFGGIAGRFAAIAQGAAIFFIMLFMVPLIYGAVSLLAGFSSAGREGRRLEEER